MRIVRTAASLIAFIVLLDFVVLLGAARQLVAEIVPPLIGAVVIVTVSRRDAAMPAQRRLLAGATCLFAVTIALGAVLSMSSGTGVQSAVLLALLACAIPLAWYAVVTSRRRRRPGGLAHYLET